MIHLFGDNIIRNNLGVARAAPTSNKRLSKYRRGFTLIELLVILVIVGMLAALFASSYVSWRKRIAFRQSQRTFIGIINEARSQTRRLSRTQTVDWKSDGTDSQITHDGAVTTLNNFSLKNKATSSKTGQIIFSAPFARRDTATRESIILATQGGQGAILLIYGVTGKTQVIPCEDGKVAKC